jgi:hypothetical protein
MFSDQISVSDLQSPVSRLPVDVLTKVFALVCPFNEAAILLQPVALSRPPKTSFEGGLNFSHVCRDWRHVALTSPMLWTTPIMNRTKELATTMLAHAAPAPVTMIWRPTPNAMVEDTMIIVLSPHIDHLTSLAVTATRLVLDLTLNAVVMAVPSITRVALTLLHSKDDVPGCFLTVTSQTTAQVIARPPHIEFLRTTGCFAQVPPHSFGCLKTLIVDWKLVTPHHKIGLMQLQLQHVLQACPALEILHLSLRKWSLWNEEEMQSERVTLPHLHTLLFSYSLIHIRSLMSVIDAPQLRRLQLNNAESHLPQPGRREVADFLGTLTSLHMTSDGIYRSVSLRLLQNSAEVHLNTGDLKDRDDTYSMVLTFQGYTPDLFMQILLSHWHIRWINIRELKLNSWKDYNSDKENRSALRYLSAAGLAAYLNLVPELEYLHIVQESSAATVISALVDQADQDELLCPSLCVLVFERITFHERDGLPEASSMKILDVVDRWLARTLEHSGRKLSVLEFRTCDLLGSEASSAQTWTAHFNRWVDEVKFKEDCAFHRVTYLTEE